ncbi:hypothetical protein BH11MYX3_BH11MYX3_19660 [soil metagenome]
MPMVRLLAVVALLAIMTIASPATSAEPSSLRVMSYNLNYANPDAKGTMEVIAAEDADVVLLQEIDRGWQDALSKRFAKLYPHQAFRLHARGAGGLAVLSKVAISSEELVPTPPDGWFPAQRLVVDGPFGAVQVLNVHLRPAIESGSWIKGFQTTPPVRLRQIQAFWKTIAKNLPTIVAGDFNEDTYGTAVDFVEKQGLARVPTTGPTTWRYERIADCKPCAILSMNIDHVMVDGHFTATDARVLDAGASDHRPVVVTLGKK